MTPHVVPFTNRKHPVSSINRDNVTHLVHIPLKTPVELLSGWKVYTDTMLRVVILICHLE